MSGLVVIRNYFKGFTGILVNDLLKNFSHLRADHQKTAKGDSIFQFLATHFQKVVYLNSIFAGKVKGAGILMACPSWSTG